MKEKFREELLQTQLDVQEQAFNEISREIHDGVGQTLSLAKMQINIMNESKNLSYLMLNEIKENITTAIADLRDISKSMNSDRLSIIGISSAIAHEVERVQRSGLFKISFELSGNERRIEARKELTLFRIVQESLQNIIKHSEASAVDITVNYSDNKLWTTIVDNGRGFDIGSEKTKTGNGLINIKTRALMAGGTCSIITSANQGTKIAIEIPYD